MLRSTWQDRFLVAIIFLAVFFALLSGWIIVNHYDEQPVPELSTQAQEPQATAHKSPPSIPKTFSHAFVQQMKNDMQSNTTSESNHSGSSSQFSHDFENGFQWASTHQIKNVSECSSSLNKEYVEGCQTFIEISNYISRVQVIPNFKSTE